MWERSKAWKRRSLTGASLALQSVKDIPTEGLLACNGSA